MLRLIQSSMLIEGNTNSKKRWMRYKLVKPKSKDRYILFQKISFENFTVAKINWIYPFWTWN